MYCRKCGYRLVSGEKICQNCGESAVSAEYCGGFWGLVGKEGEGTGKMASVICEEEPPMEIQPPSKIKNHSESEKMKKKRGVKISVIACCVFVILFAVQSFRVSMASKKMLEIEEKYAVLEENCIALKEEKDAASAENASLSEELDKLSDENDILTEENARLREAPWNVPSRWYGSAGSMKENTGQEMPVYDNDFSKTEE